MKIISLIYNEKKNAGPKAPADINKILGEKYNAKNITICKVGFYKLKMLFVMFFLIFSRDVIVIQYPLLLKKFLYRFLNKKRTILLIHDISGLRIQNNDVLKKELEILDMFEYIIVHNEIMKSYLISQNISEKKLYSLDAFDYLANGEIIEKSKKIGSNSLKILYAGNLKKDKSPFVYQIDNDKISFKLNLYGLGLSEDIGNNILYKGSFEPDDISDLDGDLGLIWDGNYDESDENIGFKNYTKYNNPHKLSCYLAIGIPVIVWKKAAISKFVQENGIGYVIENIYDINNIDFSSYSQKCSNSIIVGKKIRSGYFTVRIFDLILERINK